MPVEFTDATLLVSDLVGLICARERLGGLGGGGAVGLTGLVVAMLAGLFALEDGCIFDDALWSATIVEIPDLFESRLL